LVCIAFATACRRPATERYGTCDPVVRASRAQVILPGTAEYVITDADQIAKLLTFANARREVSQPTLSTMPAPNVSVTFFDEDAFVGSIGSGSNFLFISCANWKGTRTARPEELVQFLNLLSGSKRH
jgi:hypothetical protein